MQAAKASLRHRVFPHHSLPDVLLKNEDVQVIKYHRGCPEFVLITAGVRLTLEIIAVILVERV